MVTAEGWSRRNFIKLSESAGIGRLRTNPEIKIVPDRITLKLHWTYRL